jgi:hypothetical protein
MVIIVLFRDNEWNYYVLDNFFETFQGISLDGNLLNVGLGNGNGGARLGCRN